MSNLFEVVQKYRSLEHRFNVDEHCAKDFNDEFFFCLLGGYQITFELNKSCFETLKGKKLLQKKIFKKDFEDLVKTFELELEMKQFILKKDSAPVKYRFPKKGAQKLALAGKWFHDELNWSEKKLKSVDGKVARDLLCECPGVGLKTATWILRNSNIVSDLAILDVHIIRMMRNLKIIPHGLEPEKDYLEMEERYLAFCHGFKLNPAKFDLFLWEYSRGSDR